MVANEGVHINRDPVGFYIPSNAMGVGVEWTPWSYVMGSGL